MHSLKRKKIQNFDCLSQKYYDKLHITQLTSVNSQFQFSVLSWHTVVRTKSYNFWYVQNKAMKFITLAFSAIAVNCIHTGTIFDKLIDRSDTPFHLCISVLAMSNETCTKIEDEPVHLVRTSARIVKVDDKDVKACIELCAKNEACVFYRQSGT